MQQINPQNCNNIQEVRSQIDLIDEKILQLFAARYEYVKAIVKFKTNEESIIAIERKNEVIKKRGELAESLGLDKTTFENIYKMLTESNISKELEILNNKNKK